MDILHAPAAGTKLVTWTKDHMGQIKEDLNEANLVLLRGFDTEDAVTMGLPQAQTALFR